MHRMRTNYIRNIKNISKVDHIGVRHQGGLIGKENFCPNIDAAIARAEQIVSKN